MTAAALAKRLERDADWESSRQALTGPMFDSIRNVVSDLSEFPDTAQLNRMARERMSLPHNADGRPLRFVAPGPAKSGPGPADDRYEARVHREGAVETRTDNWHDLFNALVWLAWPRAKAALNAVHAEWMYNPDAGSGARRGVARDMATLFDEGGAVLASSDPALSGLLRDFRWKQLFCERRAEVRAHTRCLVFGHALLDRARAPYKAMTAHTLIIQVQAEFFRLPPTLQIEALDHLTAQWFGDPAHLGSARNFSPLPVLGYPGFCAHSEEAAFYDDIRVFRGGRLQTDRL